MELVTEDTVAEIDDDMQLVLYGWWVYIPDFNLSLRPGNVCIWDEEGRVFMPDYDVTVVYEGELRAAVSLRIKDNFVIMSGESIKTFFSADILYYKQDGFIEILAEWLGNSIDTDSLEQLWCELIIPENI